MSPKVAKKAKVIEFVESENMNTSRNGESDERRTIEPKVDSSNIQDVTAIPA